MKKRILLITPETREIHSYRKRQFNNFIQLTMPYLAGFVDEDRYEITLIDEYNQTIPFEQRFDLVAITVNTPNAGHCYGISRKFRSRGARVVMGGPHVTIMPEEAGQHCDHLVTGEAEETWPRFLEEFFQGNASRLYACERPPSLEGLPLPKRDLIKKRKFTKGAVFASRGCPYRCSYCNLKQIYCPLFRTRPVSEVLEDIQAIGRSYFVFWDDNFFGDAGYAKELMRALKPLKKRWAAQVTIDRCQDEELLRHAGESGCLYLFIGLESFSAESLASANKKINDVAAYSSTIKAIHDQGISVQAGLIFGFDTDTKDVFPQALASCEDLGIDGVTPSVLTPLPGTPIYEEWKLSGRLRTTDWTHYNGKTHVAFEPKNMTAAELFEGYMSFRRDFYSFRSILKRLSVSRTNVFHNLVVNMGYRLSL